MKKYFFLPITLLLLQSTSLTQQGWLEQNPFLIDTISTVTCEQFNPAVSFGGNKYIVFWEDDRVIPINLHGAIISESGIVQNKTMTLNLDYRIQPDVAFDGSNYIVAYLTSIYNGNIQGLRYDTNGELVYPYDFIIHEGGEGDFSNLNICFGLNNYLVGWNQYYCRGYMGFQIVYPNGQLGNWRSHLGERIESVAFDGENYFVLLGWGPRGYRVDTSGTVIDTNWIQISTGNDWNSCVAFDGTNHLVIWQKLNNFSFFDIYGARVSTFGEILDTLGFPISIADSNQVNPEVTFDGENYIVVWEDYRNGQEADIYGAKVGTEGNVIASFPVSTQDGSQLKPVLCKGSGNQVLVAYSGWTGEYQGKTYNSMRIWGRMLGEPSYVSEDNNILVTDYRLEQNYPNPFNPSTKIKYSIPQSSNVIIKVFDILGNEITTLVNEEKPAGTYEVTWYGESLPSGIYFYKLQAGSFVETKKMLLMK